MYLYRKRTTLKFGAHYRLYHKYAALIGEGNGNLVIPEDKRCISELVWSFFLSKIDTKFHFCDKIIDVE